VCVAIEDSFVIVVVEGVSKAIRRYEKLVTKRVDWTAGADDDDDGDADNKCTCVWVRAARALRGEIQVRNHPFARLGAEKVPGQRPGALFRRRLSGERGGG
jgi:hypothetical protein